MKLVRRAFAATAASAVAVGSLLLASVPAAAEPEPGFSGGVPTWATTAPVRVYSQPYNTTSYGGLVELAAHGSGEALDQLATAFLLDARQDRLYAPVTGQQLQDFVALIFAPPDGCTVFASCAFEDQTRENTLAWLDGLAAQQRLGFLAHEPGRSLMQDLAMRVVAENPDLSVDLQTTYEALLSEFIAYDALANPAPTELRALLRDGALQLTGYPDTSAEFNWAWTVPDADLRAALGRAVYAAVQSGNGAFTGHELVGTQINNVRGTTTPQAMYESPYGWADPYTAGLVRGAVEGADVTSSMFRAGDGFARVPVHSPATPRELDARRGTRWAPDAIMSAPIEDGRAVIWNDSAASPFVAPVNELFPGLGVTDAFVNGIMADDTSELLGAGVTAATTGATATVQPGAVLELRAVNPAALPDSDGVKHTWVSLVVLLADGSQARVLVHAFWGPSAGSAPVAHDLVVEVDPGEAATVTEADLIANASWAGATAALEALIDDMDPSITVDGAPGERSFTFAAPEDAEPGPAAAGTWRAVKSVYVPTHVTYESNAAELLFVVRGAPAGEPPAANPPGDTPAPTDAPIRIETGVEPGDVEVAPVVTGFSAGVVGGVVAGLVLVAVMLRRLIRPRRERGAA